MTTSKIILQTVLLLLLMSGAFQTALAGPVEVQSIQIAPAETRIGIYPDITGAINVSKVTVPGETLEIIVIAVVVRPDHVMKSWTWKQVIMKAGEVKKFIIPKEYGVPVAGTYKVDFNVYTKDLKPLHRLSKSFVVIDQTLPPSKAIIPKKEISQAIAQPAEYPHFGIGLYANTLNPSGGATVLLWPLKYVGIQGSYTMGSFTITEVRLLARFPFSAGINAYGGIGYLSVSTERQVNVINVKSTFRDSGVSGVIGAEIPLSKTIYGYVELSRAKIDLTQEVTNGVMTGTATVDYNPVTIGIGIVYYLF